MRGVVRQEGEAYIASVSAAARASGVEPSGIIWFVTYANPSFASG